MAFRVKKRRCSFPQQMPFDTLWLQLATIMYYYIIMYVLEILAMHWFIDLSLKYNQNKENVMYFKFATTRFVRQTFHTKSIQFTIIQAKNSILTFRSQEYLDFFYNHKQRQWFCEFHSFRIYCLMWFDWFLNELVYKDFYLDKNADSNFVKPKFYV